jgi:hypothetical protein
MSTHAEAWIEANQVRTQKVFRTGPPQPGSRRERALQLSRGFAKWFLRVAAAYLIIGALVLAVVIVA